MQPPNGPRSAPANPWGITLYGEWSDTSRSAPLRNQLDTQGIACTEAPLPHLVGMGGTAYLIGYTSPTSGHPVTVLTIPHRYDVDSFGEDYYYLEGVSIEEAVARGEPYWVDDVYPAVKDWQ